MEPMSDATSSDMPVMRQIKRFNAPDGCMTTTDLAALIGRNRRTIQRWCQWDVFPLKGVVPIDTGTQHVFRRSEVAAWLVEHPFVA